MLFYLIPVFFVFSIFLSALWLSELESANSTHLWFCIILASLLWPATLPSMLAKASSVCWHRINHPLAE
jgi:hypothetical protein